MRPSNRNSGEIARIETELGLAPAPDPLSEAEPARLPTLWTFKSTPPHLSRRELQILHLLADGLTTREIASRSGISFKTAASHRSNILQRFQVNNTTLAVRAAIRFGLIQP